MTKYRIVKETDEFGFGTIYRIQYRFLWMFWINIYPDAVFNTLEKAIREIKHLNNKITKEVVYEE